MGHERQEMEARQRPQRLYTDLAAWWPLLSPPEEYAEEASFFLDTLSAALPAPHLPRRQTLVEFGSGGGSLAFHLKAQFDLTLVDLSSEMLAVSRNLNPECEHLLGDMRSARLGRVFDVVFIHDAIDYMTTEANLRMAFETAFLHCAPGGVALIVPDAVRETFQSATEHGGYDGDGRALRYLLWQFDPDPEDTVYTAQFAFLLREGNTVHIEQDHHTYGLFARADWLRLLGEVGFAPEVLTDEYERMVFLNRKPA